MKQYNISIKTTIDLNVFIEFVVFMENLLVIIFIIEIIAIDLYLWLSIKAKLQSILNINTHSSAILYRLTELLYTKTE